MHRRSTHTLWHQHVGASVVFSVSSVVSGVVVGGVVGVVVSVAVSVVGLAVNTVSGGDVVSVVGCC